MNVEKKMYKTLRKELSVLLVFDFRAWCSSCLGLQQLHMQIWLFGDNFMLISV